MASTNHSLGDAPLASVQVPQESPWVIPRKSINPAGLDVASCLSPLQALYEGLLLAPKGKDEGWLVPGTL